MPVALSCRAAAAGPWTAYLRARGRRLLHILALDRRELSLSLVDDAEMRTLNRAYRGQDRATDVLSFPLDGALAAGRPGGAAALLGDVVISIDTAVRQARTAHGALAARLDVLLVHGVLHLLGYDHEVSAAEARRMVRREREIRRALSAAARVRGGVPTRPRRGTRAAGGRPRRAT